MMPFVDTTIVSTRGNHGHFHSHYTSERERAAATISDRGGETTNRRRGAGARCIGSTGGASAWSECQPIVCLATAVSAGAARTCQSGDAWFAGGARDAGGQGSSAKEKRTGGVRHDSD